MKRVRIFVSGRVQGVFFRSTCARLARQRGVGGFVRNLPDGRVEAAFEGPRDAVDGLVAWSRKGPDRASVEAVEVLDEAPVGDVAFRLV